jgi:hypothetical protein
MGVQTIGLSFGKNLVGSKLQTIGHSFGHEPTIGIKLLDPHLGECKWESKLLGPHLGECKWESKLLGPHLGECKWESKLLGLHLGGKTKWVSKVQTIGPSN